jgi:hypothetical protein
MADVLSTITSAMITAFGDMVSAILGGIAGILPVGLPVMAAFAVLSAGFAAFRMVRKGK